jgi:hypothetical protein
MDEVCEETTLESIRRMLRSGGSSAQEEPRPQTSRAEALIAEFEASEKGWFWETDRDGKLSVIRRKRDYRAHARLLPLLACRISGPDRSGEDQERDLVVDFRTAGAR